MHIFQKILFLCLWLIPQLHFAQVAPPDTSETEQVIVDHSDVGEYLQEGERSIQLLMKKERQVELRQGDAYMYCDTAIIEENDVVAYGNVIIQQGDSVNVFADSLIFIGNARVADLYGAVVLETGEQRLFTEELNYNLDTKVATYYSGALLTNEQTQLTSKRGYFYVDRDEAFFKDSVIVIDEEFTLQADTLEFNTKSKVATFLGPTLIQQDSARIYCEEGFYDTANKTAEFTKNAQYVKGDQQATADVIRYDGDSDQVTLVGEAKFVEGTKIANADTIRYDNKEEVTFLEGNAVYQDDGQYIESDRIRYDTQTESVKTEGRSRIVDEAQILIADQIDYDNAAQIGLAEGNVYWVDTVEQITIRCENAVYDKATDYLKATGGRPLMTTLVDGDTLYLAADTLISFRPSANPDTTAMALDSTATVLDSTAMALDSMAMALDSMAMVSDSSLIALDTLLAAPDTTLVALDTTQTFADSTMLGSLDSLASPDSLLASPEAPEDARNLIAQKNVMIYKSNMQAVCDSLTYSTADSMFQLFVDPIIWSDTSQFSADVIHMQLANDKIDRIFLYKNSFIVNSPDEIFFNQIKGRDIVAFFEEDEVRRVKVDGNAESVYYALDDAKAYVAVNKTVCSEMMLFFGNNEIEAINFYRKPTATMYPMKDADHQSLELPGFFWKTEGRPRSVVDLQEPIAVVVPEKKPVEEESLSEEGEKEKADKSDETKKIEEAEKTEKVPSKPE